MITDVRGVRVGHWTDVQGRTGCTVVLFPEGTVASGEVRGGAPGTREWALLAPERTVAHLDAVVLCGGSAFGLAACDGVVRWCEERNRGVPTVAGPVPIVVGAVLYDLAVGSAHAHPTAEDGYAACVAARAGRVASGAVGAGCGATIGRWRGRAHVRPGGIGTASLRLGRLVVGALVAVNAWGDVRPADSAGRELSAEQRRALSGIARSQRRALGGEAPGRADPVADRLNTTLGVVATNARLTKTDCYHVAQSAHDGLARALEPVHASVDGDALVVGATGRVEAVPDAVRVLAARAVEAAIRAAVPPVGSP